MDKDTLFEKKRLLNCNGKYINLTQPQVMGILNITRDSFFDGGNYLQKDSIKKRIKLMIDEGTDIIDVGAASSRPGAKEISVGEELQRLQLALDCIREDYPEIIVSVDTYRSTIAKKVIQDYKVNIINDISAGLLDENMAETIASHRAAYIVMHMPGSPLTMQQNTLYSNLVLDIISFLGQRCEKLKTLGITDIVVDPGFGFGKSLEQNYQLLGHLDAFNILKLPILVGLSRKSMIYKLLKISPNDALNGTMVLNTLALAGGADILRVHDVGAAKQAITLFYNTRLEKNNYLEQTTL